MSTFKQLKVVVLSTAIALPSATAFGAPTGAVSFLDLVPSAENAMIVDVKKGRSGTGVRGRDRDRDGDRGRGRGRGGDDGPGHVRHGHDDGHISGDGSDDGPNDVSGSGRDRPRIPGGSGCDDAGDRQEHAGC